MFLRLFYTLFLMNQNQEDILYPQWSSPIFYPTTKVQNSEIFSPRMSTKCKIFSRILFADQKRKIRLKPFFFSSPLFDLTLLPVYIMTVIKVKLRVELYLFLLASKIFSSFRVAPAISVIRKILITENTKATTCHIIYRYGYQSLLYDILRL